MCFWTLANFFFFGSLLLTESSYCSNTKGCYGYAMHVGLWAITSPLPANKVILCWHVSLPWQSQGTFENRAENRTVLILL